LRSARGAPIGVHRRHVAQVFGREPAAEIDHGQVDAAIGAGAKDRRCRLQRLIPRRGTPLLRADVKRHAAGFEPQPLRVVEHVDRHLRIAAELARQRPFGASAAEQEAAEDLGARSGAADLLHLGFAVDREQPNAERVGTRDVPFLLDRVAEGDAVGRGAGRQHQLDLSDRGGVEAGAKRGQQRQQLRCRVGLHRIEHAAVRQRLGKGPIVLAHEIEIDDQARAVVTAIVAAVAQEFADALGHGRRSFVQVQRGLSAQR
jgi:hypothetical protein